MWTAMASGCTLALLTSCITIHSSEGNTKRTPRDSTYSDTDLNRGIAFSDKGIQVQSYTVGGRSSAPASHMMFVG